ncbi:hypothetical protein CDD82_202 [Ophiocordyceps australis]|uniref:Deacetylase sirtuin-type domain-containing protein n=1 Tax=Ophiocordyceps australis TaxID=1399860 RepID=A0A2C5YPP2_9HYPO|nr:hypothetical protein CDD82_202 [Ophiocordyceps australis]
MPTVHALPQSHDHLSHVASSLLKARKVVVITGAGISTNSGIPDFRSDNGLYSLIQAQFEHVARQPRQPDLHVRGNVALPPSSVSRVAPDADASLDTIYVKSPSIDANDAAQRDLDSFDVNSSPPACPHPATSPLSSPPPSSIFNSPTTHAYKHRKPSIDVILPLSSSPPSSPSPSGIASPSLPSSTSSLTGHGSSRQDSPYPEQNQTNNASKPLDSSQTSTSSRNSLPSVNMKGRDLFDAAIWSDPLRTSVFYTFATSLRQKVKTAEPTDSHRFIGHLRDRGKLVRCYTQNIDQIEEKVGLKTCLQAGPGNRGRFSRRSAANSRQLDKMVPDTSLCSNEQATLDDANSTEPSSSPDSESGEAGQATLLNPGFEPDASESQDSFQPQKLPGSHGVECVFLHGSLERLRCFRCAQLCSWDDEREAETLTGQQPECPHCAGATAAREEKGKRALGVGKLRPDIVLYGEEHPNSHLISPIITHDLSLHPDMLLILGTSLRVHGLKVMVREFAKAVHSKGGKVVFVNFTKPPSWGDMIDYWIQWDCDAWVADLQSRVPQLWKPHSTSHKGKTQGTSQGTSTPGNRPAKTKKPPVYPAAVRDTKATGAYWTCKILQDLHRITGTRFLLPPKPPCSDKRAGEVSEDLETEALSSDLAPQAPPQKLETKKSKPRPRQAKKIISNITKRKKQPPSTLNPNRERPRQTKQKQKAPSMALTGMEIPLSSILNAVKENPRIRKRKKIDGEEVPAPCIGRKRGVNGQNHDQSIPPELKLAPFQSPAAPETTLPLKYGKPEPLEPRSPPSGPLMSLSPNLRSFGSSTYSSLYSDCQPVWGTQEAIMPALKPTQLGLPLPQLQRA